MLELLYISRLTKIMGDCEIIIAFGDVGRTGGVVVFIFLQNNDLTFIVGWYGRLEVFRSSQGLFFSAVVYFFFLFLILGVHK